MKNTMLSILFIAVLLLSACSGVSVFNRVPATKLEVDHAVSLIDAIGEVDYTSLSAINRAEHAYASLTDEQKQEVTNAQTLLDARSAYNALTETPSVGG